MRYSILFPILVAVVLTGGATFFITKSVCSNSNSESQVVAYLKEKEAEKTAYAKKQMEADREASKRSAEARRNASESLRNPNRNRDSQKGE